MRFRGLFFFIIGLQSVPLCAQTLSLEAGPSFQSILQEGGGGSPGGLASLALNIDNWQVRAGHAELGLMGLHWDAADIGVRGQFLQTGYAFPFERYSLEPGVGIFRANVQPYFHGHRLKSQSDTSVFLDFRLNYFFRERRFVGLGARYYHDVAGVDFLGLYSVFGISF